MCGRSSIDKRDATIIMDIKNVKKISPHNKLHPTTIRAISQYFFLIVTSPSLLLLDFPWSCSVLQFSDCNFASVYERVAEMGLESDKRGITPNCCWSICTPTQMEQDQLGEMLHQIDKRLEKLQESIDAVRRGERPHPIKNKCGI